MLTGQWIQRFALSSALLVLPLIIYCSEISENPHSELGSAGQTEAVTPSVPPAISKISSKEKPRDRKILADMINSPRPGF
jgi:hypothetical protein